MRGVVALASGQPTLVWPVTAPCWLGLPVSTEVVWKLFASTGVIAPIRAAG